MVNLTGKPQSGLSKPIGLLAYPPLAHDIGLVRGVFCYIIKPYKLSGISCLIARSDGDVRITVGDFRGNAIDLLAKSSIAVIANEFLKQYLAILIQYTKLVGVDKIIYYFSLRDDNTLVLVDARLSINKFLGPGMLRDVFGKRLPTQEVKGIEVLSNQLFEQLQAGTGIFRDDVILKPSRFRFLPTADPCYVYHKV